MNIYDFMLGLGALVFMLVIIIAGFRMLLYQFAENPDSELGNAKLMLRRGIFGFMIILLAFLAVRTVLIVLGLPAGFFGGPILAPLQPLVAP